MSAQPSKIARVIPMADDDVEVEKVKLREVEPLLLQADGVAAILGIGKSSIDNLLSRDPEFPQPIAWPLASRRWQHSEIVEYVRSRKRRAR